MVSALRVTCFSLLFIPLLAVFGPFVLHRLSYPSDVDFTFSRVHLTTPFPDSSSFQVRLSEYSHLDSHFFQWWNFLITDQKTENHFQFIYQMTNFSSKAKSDPEVLMGFIHFDGSERKFSARQRMNLNEALHYKQNPFELSMYEPKTNKKEGYYSMKVHENRKDGSQIFEIDMIVPPEENTAQETVTVHLNFTRIYGNHAGVGNEESNKNSGPEYCYIVSNLFAYNSYVNGVIEYGSKQKYTFENDFGPRYRAYAAGSWGCQLPSALTSQNEEGAPANSHEYPWTWFWLIIPEAGIDGADIGIVMGGARFEMKGLGSIYGLGSSAAFGGGSSPNDPEIIHSTMQARLFHNTSLEIPMKASSSDGLLKHHSVQLLDWDTYSDSYGTALLPKRQIYILKSRCFNYSIDWHSTIPEYFRAPVTVEHFGKKRIFSDFRAVNVDVNVKIERIDSKQGEEKCPWEDKWQQWKKQKGIKNNILYEGTVSKMNALEFAYESPVEIKKFEEMLWKTKPTLPK